MANKKSHRGFGNVRQRDSGRWQARYRGPDGRLRSAPNTFATKREAEQWLSLTEAQLLGGNWVQPERAKVRLGDYGAHWIEQRPGLRPRTVQLYRWLFAKHVVSQLGGITLDRLSTPIIRQWRAKLIEKGVSESVTAKAYRLLRAMLNTAVDEDRILTRNPCKVRGADRENPPERPVATVDQVFELARNMPGERFRVLILVTAFCTLRWGEVTALRRCDIAADGSWIRVSFAHTDVAGRGIVVGPPKSRAGVRTVAVPMAIRAEVVAHLVAFTGPEPVALVFTGTKGGPLRSSNFYQRVKWTKTVAELGVAGLHFHDLRHSGNVWAAQAGASTKDLMARMGHDDMRAALIYQRATSEADRLIADRLSALAVGHARQAPDEDGDGDEGTAGVLVPT